MATFSGSPVVSPFPDYNSLYDSARVDQAIQGHKNALLTQEHNQQVIGAQDMEMVARAAAPLLDMSPEAAAAAYPGVIAGLQAQGYAKHAPAAYPGHAVARQLVSMGIPAEKQWERGANQAAIRSVYTPPSGDGTTGGASGGAAAPTAPSAPGTGATIGQRQNNPGNLTFAGQPNATPGQGNRFASFPDMPTGVAANADQLALYQTQHGINTVRGAVTRWVSDPKADLTSYIADIAKSLGVSPDAPIDLTNPDVQAKFIQAQFPHESAGGGYVLNPADVAKGVQMAAARRGQIVQPAPGTATAGTVPPPYRVAGQMQPPPGGAPGAPGATVRRETQVRGADGVVRTVVQTVPATAPPARTETVEPETGLPVVSGPAAAPVATAAAPPPPAPIAPVAVAQAPPAPSPTPAAPAAPALPPPPSASRINGYTREQHNVLGALAAPGSPATLAQFMAQRKIFDDDNAQSDARYDAQVQRIESNQQHAETQRLAREAAARDEARLRMAQEAANQTPYQHERILNDLAPKIRDGTATDEEKRRYAISYYGLQQAGGQSVTMTDPNNAGQQIPAMITRRLPPAFPEPEGGALPLVLATPGAAKQEPATADQSKNAGYADRLQQALPIITDTSPAAMNRWQQLRGEVPLVGNSLVSPEFQMHMQAERNFITALLRRESGAAISPSEFDMARKQYIPQPGDSPQALALKEQNRQTVLAGIIRDAGPNYKPTKAETTTTTSTTTQGNTGPPPRGYKVVIP